jgi:hypothetical protein
MVRRRLLILDFRFWIASVSLLYFSHVALAQDVRVTARVDSNNISIGDHVNLYLEVRHPNNISVTWPSVADSLQGLEVIQSAPPTTKTENSHVIETARYTLTSFDSGFVGIPPLTFYYTTANDTTKKSVETSPIPILVHGVAIDTTQDIKDIKPPLSLSITIAELLPYLMVVIIVGGLVWLFLYIRKKRKKGESLLPEAPPRPAHEIALEALKALEGERLWQRGKIKEYHSQLSDIIRTYIEQRFGAKAMEMVTDEIMNSDVIRNLDNNARLMLKELLVLADFVKFAKYQPTPQEHEQSMRRAFSFVEATHKKPEEQVHTANEEEVVHIQ